MLAAKRLEVGCAARWSNAVPSQPSFDCSAGRSAATQQGCLIRLWNTGNAGRDACGEDCSTAATTAEVACTELLLQRFGEISGFLIYKEHMYLSNLDPICRQAPPVLLSGVRVNCLGYPGQCSRQASLLSIPRGGCAALDGCQPCLQGGRGVVDQMLTQAQQPCSSCGVSRGSVIRLQSGRAQWTGFSSKHSFPCRGCRVLHIGRPLPGKLEGYSGQARDPRQRLLSA